jgi:hypothetical protein
VEPALEMSKRGATLGFSWQHRCSRRNAGSAFTIWLGRLGVPVKGSGLGDGIEVFSRHNAIGEKEFGNAIRGPLGIHRGGKSPFLFYGADYTLDAQMAYLNRLRKLTETEPAFMAPAPIP